MSNKINDGGPAFPQPLYKEEITGQYVPPGAYGDLGGMTLRDYFAAAALQGCLANPDANGSRAALAEDAYLYADAMLERRKR